MAKMAVVVGKNKKKSLKKKAPGKKESKFVSQALINRKKSKGRKKKRPKTRGMVYVKNLPHGFFEEQLRNYFSQFGAITRLRLGRSPKTLNSRGYAFIEFRYPEVAEIAADTMNNYIMFHRIVKAKFIPPQEIHHDYFRSNISTIRKDGVKVLTSKSILARQANVENTNKLMTDKDQKNRITKVRNKLSKQKARLAALGIDFDIDSVAKNMGEEVIAKKKNVLTIDNLKEEDLDDEADETFDPAKLDIDSNDDFEDFNYDDDSDASEIDEATEIVKKKTAIEVAKTVSKKQKNEKATEKVEKPKVQKEIKPVAKVTKKTAKKVAEKSEVKVEKPAKKQKEVKKAIDKGATKPVTRSKPLIIQKEEQPEKVEKIVKSLKENKKLKTPQKKSVPTATPATTQKKVQKAANEKVNKSTKESPKLKKVSKVSKKIKKVTAK